MSKNCLNGEILKIVRSTTNQCKHLPAVEVANCKTCNINRINFETDKVIFSAVFILVFVIFSAGCSSPRIDLSATNEQIFSANAADAAKEKEIIIQAGELIKEYRENQTAADEKYRGKMMSVSGEVSGWLKTPGYIWISVRGEGNFSSSDPNPLGVGCVFAEPEKVDFEKVKNYQKITVVGKNGGMKPAKMMRDGEYVTLENCQIDDKSPSDESGSQINANKLPKTAGNTPEPLKIDFPDASTGKLPTDEQLQAMLQKTIQDLAAAIETEDFTNFKTTVSKGAVAYNVPPERLKMFYGHQMMLPRLRKIIGTKPTFSRPPAIDKYTLTRADKTTEVFPAINLSGIYENTDSPVKFEVQYLAEGKDWKVSIFNFTPK